MRAVNLLPESDRRRSVPLPTNASYFALGALGALLLAMVALVLTDNQIDSHRTAIASARAETQAAEARAAMLGSFGQFSEIKQTRLQSVTSLSTARFDWERLMRELALVLPEDVWITEATASSTGPAAGATPPTSADPAALANPSVKLVGCAKSQAQVAEVMVRLRNLHRAEDVKLTESSEAAAADSSGDSSGAAVGGCDQRFKFDVTVLFSAAPPAPNVEGERGGFVPSRLGGGA